MAKKAKLKWSIEADYVQGCSCDYGCPCEFQAPPSAGYCEGLGAWRVNRGRYGDVKLDGLCFGYAALWPKALHFGGGTAAMFFDERGNAQQREALLAIASGQAGGMPFEILATTFARVMEPQFVPFKFDLKGRNSSVKVGKSITLNLEPVKNPVTGAAESVRVEHETGFIFDSAEVVSTRVCRSTINGLAFSYPNKAGFFAKVKYGN
jgi:hypothetical protein